jgi:hypothetical protein
MVQPLVQRAVHLYTSYEQTMTMRAIVTCIRAQRQSYALCFMLSQRMCEYGTSYALCY